ncbi:MAG: hypothetical protein R2727_11580 [Bacteroidales bacterium]
MTRGRKFWQNCTGLPTLSRNLSVIGRREVLSGKAKFGIFEMARRLPAGTWLQLSGRRRSGYYRDQTWMMAMGLYDAEGFFHQTLWQYRQRT